MQTTSVAQPRLRDHFRPTAIRDTTPATMLRVYTALIMRYRVMLALWAMAGVVQTFVSLAVWRSVAASGGMPAGWSTRAFAGYFLAVMLLDEWTHTWTHWMWEWRVRQGTFSALLVRPSPPLLMEVCDNLAVKIVSMSIKLPIAIAAGYVAGVRLHLDAVQVAGAATAIVLAYVLRTFVEATIACAAFHVTRMQAVAGVWGLVFSFLSGIFAPIALLPEPLHTLAVWSPARWVIAFPVRALLGDLGHRELALGLAAQLAWTGIAIATFIAAWRASTRRFTAVGS